MSSLTFFRCYWPEVYHYLKDSQITNFKTEAFGVLMTLDLEPKTARKIMMLLPAGVVKDYVELSSLDPMSDLEIDKALGIKL